MFPPEIVEVIVDEVAALCHSGTQSSDATLAKLLTVSHPFHYATQRALMRCLSLNHRIDGPENKQILRLLYFLSEQKNRHLLRYVREVRIRIVYVNNQGKEQWEREAIGPYEANVDMMGIFTALLDMIREHATDVKSLMIIGCKMSGGGMTMPYNFDQIATNSDLIASMVALRVKPGLEHLYMESVANVPPMLISGASNTDPKLKSATFQNVLSSCFTAQRMNRTVGPFYPFKNERDQKYFVKGRKVPRTPFSYHPFESLTDLSLADLSFMGNHYAPFHVGTAGDIIQCDYGEKMFTLPNLKRLTVGYVKNPSQGLQTVNSKRYCMFPHTSEWAPKLEHLAIYDGFSSPESVNGIMNHDLPLAHYLQGLTTVPLKTLAIVDQANGAIGNFTVPLITEIISLIKYSTTLQELSIRYNGFEVVSPNNPLEGRPVYAEVFDFLLNLEPGRDEWTRLVNLLGKLKENKLKRFRMDMVPVTEGQGGYRNLVKELNKRCSLDGKLDARVRVMPYSPQA